MFSPEVSKNCAIPGFTRETFLISASRKTAGARVSVSPLARVVSPGWDARVSIQRLVSVQMEAKRRGCGLRGTRSTFNS